MKSYFMSNMGEPQYGIFSGCQDPDGVQTVNDRVRLIGTIRTFDDVSYETEGIAKTYKNGILIVDEFSAITNAFKVSYNNQMDSQMLALLDHGRNIQRFGRRVNRIPVELNIVGRSSACAF